MKLAGCRYDLHRALLTVSFGNGDRFEVPVETLMQSSAGARWDRLRVGETQDVLEIPVADGVAEIPWDRIRSVADPAYRQHLAEQAARSARRVAGRLRQLRRETGLTQAAVARAAGVARITISRLETGQLQPTYQTLVRVLAGMGKSVGDLATDQETVPVSGGVRRRPRSRAAQR
jgi:DNA-binding XRE family transcriptional regulator